jgi:hypothetical protein
MGGVFVYGAPYSERRDELTAEGGDVGDNAAPDQEKDGRETLEYVSDGALGLSQETPPSLLVWTLV